MAAVEHGSRCKTISCTIRPSIRIQYQDFIDNCRLSGFFSSMLHLYFSLNPRPILNIRKSNSAMTQSISIPKTLHVALKQYIESTHYSLSDFYNAILEWGYQYRHIFFMGRFIPTSCNFPKKFSFKTQYNLSKLVQYAYHLWKYHKMPELAFVPYPSGRRPTTISLTTNMVMDLDQITTEYHCSGRGESIWRLIAWAEQFPSFNMFIDNTPNGWIEPPTPIPIQYKFPDVIEQALHTFAAQIIKYRSTFNLSQIRKALVQKQKTELDSLPYTNLELLGFLYQHYPVQKRTEFKHPRYSIMGENP